MFSNYRSYYNKEPEQRCMTDHRITNNSHKTFFYRALPNLYPELYVLTLYPASVNA
jgi:hypothetical protein